MLTYRKREPTGRYEEDENGQLVSIKYVEIRCKTTDEKPVKGIANGSVCIDMDTKDVFFFDEETKSWI